MRRAIARVAAVVLASAALITAAGGAPAGAVVSWAFTEDAVSLGMEGVSPHVERVSGADRVWRATTTAAGTAASLCTDAGACTAETFSTGGGGPVADFTIAQSPSGPRAYFVLVSPSSGTKAVYSAACATAECLAIGAATLASTGMQVSTDAKAWGVPDAVRLPDGRIRIYIVESPADGACPEKVASYISSDGVSFTKESGWRFEGGYVDTEVLRAKDGEWVMIMANGPGCGGLQRLFVSTSNDGLTWATPVALTSGDAGRLDPTGYETSAGSNVFRIYYATCSSNPCPNNTYAVKRGTLSVAAGSGAVSVTSGAAKSSTTTITCVKGKLTKKVTGKAPKCPKGYTKK